MDSTGDYVNSDVGLMSEHATILTTVKVIPLGDFAVRSEQASDWIDWSLPLDMIATSSNSSQ
jgi:hypothetical protein